MKNLWYISLFAIMLISCEKNISEFQTQNFIKFIGTVDGGDGFDVFELTEGGYLITGSVVVPQLRKQILVARIDRAGNVVWQKQFGTEHNEVGVVVESFNNEIFIAGNKVHYLTGISEGFLMRVSMQGDSLDFYSYTAQNNLVFNDMSVSNNSIYLAGEQYLSSITLTKAYLACVNTNGSSVWQRAYGNNDVSQNYKKIYIKSNGGLLVVGTSKVLLGTNFTNISVVEMNSSGVAIGGANLTANSDQTFGNSIYNGSNLIVLSSTTQGASVTSRLASVSNSNSVEWETVIPLSGQGVAMAELSDNIFIVASENNSQVIFHTLQILDGSVQETEELKNFPGNVRSIINTNDNGVISIGTTSPDYGTMVRLIKTDAELYLLKP